MNKKIILIGIVLLTTLTACADRDDDHVYSEKTENKKIEKVSLKSTNRPVIDSTKTQDEINGTNSNEIVDPTKPDKPW